MKKYFLTGVVILLPVAITIAVIGYLVNFFTTPFVHTVSTYLCQYEWANHGFLFLSSEQVINYLSKLLILICLFFVILLLGMLTRLFLIRFIVHIGDRLLHKIPFINTVYKTTQEIIKSIFTPDSNAFKQVVLVPFPRKDTYALGLVVGSAPASCSATHVTVLLPTTPSPISGFLLLYKPEELIYIDMKPEQAIKYIISCGVLTPDTKVIP